jgi:hypothetical protein
MERRSKVYPLAPVEAAMVGAIRDVVYWIEAAPLTLQ